MVERTTPEQPSPHERRTGAQAEQHESARGRISAAELSLAKENAGRKNQDASLVDTEHGVFAVFDGLGGHMAGEVASREARTLLQQMARSKVLDKPTVEQTQDAVRRSLESIHRILAERNKRPERAGAATTAVIVKLIEQPGQDPVAVIGHAGDSRAMLIPSQGEPRNLTIDHNLIQDYPDDKEDFQNMLDQLHSRADIPRNHPQRAIVDLLVRRRNVITSSLGGRKESTSPDMVDVTTVPLRRGDRLVLMTDGVTDNLTFNERVRAVARTDSSDSAVRRLVQGAKLRSVDAQHPRAKEDDITAVVVEHQPVSSINDIRITRGDVVPFFNRKSEQLEPWTVRGFNELTKQAVLERHGKDDALESIEVDPTDLRVGVAIDRAESIDEVMEVIRELGGLPGTKKGTGFTFQELRDLVNAVARGERPARVLTRRAGFRDKIVQLMQQR